MLRLKQRIKQAQKEGEKNSSKTAASVALIRITKDINELKLPTTCSIDFPDPNDLFRFKLTISPDEGYYQNGSFVFHFHVPNNYPYEPPKVKCETEIYHPNIDSDGNICLNILREDWKPVLSIDSVVYGLQYLLLEPNPHDPLNKTAAEVFMMDKTAFAENVKRVMRRTRGGSAVTKHIRYCYV
ncbi:nedd8-conjugating enzyme UbcE2M-like [Argiope bruennichi]|uniref:nedd8-conjugating enzyme UbcE2M-like n=1 Tax=Argiope bruennichi TaxID=94029 RepID=UPI00249421BD|nr:nedd8-conjugating enzyme UbcE2M-like [Argiope bruennichi]